MNAPPAFQIDVVGPDPPPVLLLRPFASWARSSVDPLLLDLRVVRTAPIHLSTVASLRVTGTRVRRNIAGGAPYEDNTACIEWGNHVIGGRERAKNIDLRKHFAHETIQNRMMRLIKIDTSKQLEDIFTKPLAYAQFIGCVRGILGDPDAMRQTKAYALQARLSAGPGDSGGGARANSLLRTR